MKSQLIVGITGGIGSGKTTLSNLIRSNGYHVFDSDIEARKLQNENLNVRQKLIALFGSDIYNLYGFDRSKASKLVFENKKLLIELNNIVHPAVKTHFENWVQNHKNDKVLFIESAILFESGFDDLVNKIIVITAAEDVRINRVVKRDNITHEQVRLRISSQMSENLKLLKADFVIYSNDIISLNIKLNEVLNQILSEVNNL